MTPSSGKGTELSPMITYKPIIPPRLRFQILRTSKAISSESLAQGSSELVPLEAAQNALR